MGSCSTVWMGLVAVVVLLGGVAEATTCDEVMNQGMQTCLSYLRGQSGGSASTCCGAVTSMEALDKNAVCSCLKDELVRSPVSARLAIRISVTCDNVYSNYLLVRVFTAIPSRIDCSR